MISLLSNDKPGILTSLVQNVACHKKNWKCYHNSRDSKHQLASKSPISHLGPSYRLAAGLYFFGSLPPPTTVAADSSLSLGGGIWVKFDVVDVRADFGFCRPMETYGSGLSCVFDWMLLVVFDVGLIA